MKYKYLPINDEEIIKHKQLLSNTPVRNVVASLDNGILKLKKILIESNLSLGENESIFANLGSGQGNIVAKQAYGIDRFLIKHIFEVLENPRCNDVASLKSIKFFLSNLENNQFSSVITLYSYDSLEYIIDGNKSASALYIFNTKQKIDHIHLPIFLIEQ